jgi:hypothetical protein
MEGFYFVISLTGLDIPNTVKDAISVSGLYRIEWYDD